ncbi:DUF2254 domain-containing protein [Rossellomorea aquimaris]|uniref:DUF2254 domain-containing protein n=1 Tax=Rossellomorea aquimaris TaxID=189382 RepID=UPI001CD7D940|nr:DUF2254 domain-containing protein [Rossellomorea aquimaris]MCA1053815.1 DUF2254 domain-containing protein [Rossellomorea aquimaris]
MKKLFMKIKKGLWLVPAAYSLASLGLAILTITLDTYWIHKIEPFLPQAMLTSIDLAQTVLSAIASSLLTMTTFTFSTIMVVLTTYSSQFSPRTLQNFVKDKTTLRGLGIFLGGFIYSIISLLFMRQTLEEHLVSSAFVGVLYAIVCLSFFAYFIHHIATSIQISRLVERLEEEALKVLKFYKKLQAEHSVETYKEIPEEQYTTMYEARAPKSGFIQYVDFSDMIKAASEEQVLIDFRKEVGDFVKEGEVIFNIYGSKGIQTDFITYIFIGRERMGEYDLAYSLQKIVEIALRAISPGINDPNTARDAIKYIGVILSEMNELRDGVVRMKDEAGENRVFFHLFSFNKILYKTFYQLVHYGKGDISVILSIMDALIMIYNEVDTSRKHIIFDFHNYLVHGMNKEEMQEWDLYYLNKKIEQLTPDESNH